MTWSSVTMFETSDRIPMNQPPSPARTSDNAGRKPW